MSAVLRLFGILARAAMLAAAVDATARLLLRFVKQRQPGVRPVPPGTGPRQLGRMVQDPVCGVYVSEERALSRPGKGGVTVHFCGSACRDAYDRGALA